MESYKDVLDYLVFLDSDFENMWNSNDNYNVHEDGSSTICGVLNEFTQYLSSSNDAESKPYLEELFNFVERHVDDKTDLGGALRTCFLEDLAHTTVGGQLEPFMGSRSLYMYRGGSFGWNQ